MKSSATNNGISRGEHLSPEKLKAIKLASEQKRLRHSIDYLQGAQRVIEKKLAILATRETPEPANEQANRELHASFGRQISEMKVQFVKLATYMPTALPSHNNSVPAEQSEKAATENKDIEL